MPMPRVVKIMPQLLSDARTFKLAKKSVSYDEAIGKVTRWLMLAASYYAVDSDVPSEAFNELDMPELVECGFAAKTENGFRAKGDHEHFAWIIAQREKAIKGGEARWKNHAPRMPEANQKQAPGYPNDALNEERRTKNILNPPTPQRGGPTGQDLVRVWNENRQLGMPKCEALTGKRAKAANARLKECPDLSLWADCVRALGEWPYRGTDGTWSPNFDYLVKTDTMTKFKEGFYTKRESTVEKLSSRYLTDDDMERIEQENAGQC